MKTQTQTDKATPIASALALKIALQLYPNGLPSVSYCWDTEEENEARKQRDRDCKAVEIDKALNPEHAALLAVAEAAKKQVGYGQKMAFGKELSEALANLAAVQGGAK